MKDDNYWDCLDIVCIKQYDEFREGKNYKIRGRGNLEYINNTDGKTGWGICVEDETYGIFNKDGSSNLDWHNLKYSDRVKMYYLTLDELNEFFISGDENYQRYQLKMSRDSKITKLGI